MSLIRSGAIEGFQQLAAAHGINALQLLPDLGLSQAQLRNPNTYVSYSRLAELLERTAQACNCPLFGLLLAEKQSSNVLGDLSLTLTQQPTLGGALENINKYLYLHARGARVKYFRRGDNLRLQVEIDISSPLGTTQLLQLSVGQLATFVAEALQESESAFAILLQQHHPPGQEPAPRREFFARLRFAAPVDGIQIPVQWLERKTHLDEDALRNHFQDHLQRLEQRYPDDLQDQVRDIVGQLLPSGECRIERVAAALDMHPRVLQKRLKTGGNSYNALLRETRMQIARQHLQYRSMSITDLALHLGYAEVSVFSRHFKHWTGLSPRQWQNKHA